MTMIDDTQTPGGDQPPALSPEVDQGFDALAKMAGEELGTGTTLLLTDDEPLPEHPWRGMVQGGFKVIKARASGWDIPQDGADMFCDGLEQQLTRMMPRGLVDLEKHPWLLCLGGLFVIVAHNTDDVIEGGKLKFRVRPLVKVAAPAAAPAPAANQAVISGDEIQTR
jgi:hypothetical protein